MRFCQVHMDLRGSPPGVPSGSLLPDPERCHALAGHTLPWSSWPLRIPGVRGTGENFPGSFKNVLAQLEAGHRLWAQGTWPAWLDSTCLWDPQLLVAHHP